MCFSGMMIYRVVIKSSDGPSVFRELALKILCPTQQTNEGNISQRKNTNAGLGT